MKNGKRIAIYGGSAVLLLGALLTYENRSRIALAIGSHYREKLEKLEIEKCIDGDKEYQKIKNCFDSFKSTYLVLGDTVAGNFKVIFSKPFAGVSVTALDWRKVSYGAGINETISTKECFLHLQTRIPELSEDEKQILKNNIKEWVYLNPEAFQRYVTRVEKKESRVVIYSQPLRRLRDYAEYCEESVELSYLDDYPGQEYDEITIEKNIGK